MDKQASLNNLIQIASILIAFQATIFSFRINRELALKRREKRWFPIADCINLLSMVNTVFFVFIYPLKTSNYDIELCNNMFGISTILFAVYPFALIGHYELFTPQNNRSNNQPYISMQERIVLILGAIAIGMYMIV